MNASHTWTHLSAFERDCFDVCYRLTADPDDTPTQDRIYVALCELRGRALLDAQVDNTLTKLLEHSLIAHNQPESATLGFTPTKQGQAVLTHRYQQLASVRNHDGTADMEVSR